MPGECVHHLNENPYDNRIENLVAFKSQEAHWEMHKSHFVRRNKLTNKGNRLNVNHYKPAPTIDHLKDEISLYGPHCKRAKDKKFKMLAEKTKKDLGLAQ